MKQNLDIDYNVRECSNLGHVRIRFNHWGNEIRWPFGSYSELVQSLKSLEDTRLCLLIAILKTIKLKCEKNNQIWIQIKIF